MSFRGAGEVSLVLCLSMAFLFCTGCKDEAAERKLTRANQDLRTMKSKLRALEDEHEEEMEELKSTAEKATKELEKIKRERDQLIEVQEETGKKLEELEKEFKSYREKYTARMRTESIGKAFDAIKSKEGREYQKVTIRKIGLHSVSIRHAGGAATLAWNEVPDDWRGRFGLIPEPVDEPEVVAKVDDPEMKAGNENPPKPGTRSSSRSSKSDVPPEVLNALVVISGNETTGTGFLCKVGEVQYIYTAAHVLSGNSRLEVKTPTGQVIRGIEYVEIAEGVDLLRMKVTDPVNYSLTLVPVEKKDSLAVGAPIAALGDSGGKRTMTKLTGKIAGLGPESLEISSSVVKGNSGGPVMLLETWEVIGLVTHGTLDRSGVFTSGTRFDKVRRFACRLDQKHKWMKMSAGQFLGEWSSIARIDRITRLMFAMAALEPGQAGLRLDTSLGGGQTVLSIFEENKDMPAVQELIKMNRALGEKKLRTSEKDLAKRFYKYYEQVLRSANSQSSSARPERFSSFHREALQESRVWRGKAVKEFGAVMKFLSRFR